MRGTPDDTSGPTFTRSEGVSRTAMTGGVLLIGGLLLVVTVLVLLHGSPQVDVGSRPDTDTVRCGSAAGGSGGAVDKQVDRDEVDLEDDEVDSVCDRARGARTAHALEASLVAVVLLGAGAVVLTRRRGSPGR